MPQSDIVGGPSRTEFARSAELFERASKVMPRGNTRHSVFYPPHPVYAVRAQGCRVVDADGAERLDFVNNYSSLIHGHGHADVRAAVHAQIDRLVAVGLPTETEIELAELLRARVESIEHLRFMNSGTEAVMFAVKTARAFTGRPAIVKFEGCYHGTYDPVEVSQAPAPEMWGAAAAPASVPLSRGAPEGIVRDTIILPFNDVDAARVILEANAKRIAGVLLDVTPAHLGYIAAAPEMIALLREFCDAEGALFIADEVYSLRLDFGGAQKRFGFRPDLTVMGKIIGGGLPIGAVGGPARVMALFDPMPAPAVVHGGTYNANPLSMAAGLASMRALRPYDLAAMERIGDAMRAELTEFARQRKAEVTIGGLASLISFTFGAPPPRNYRDRALLPHHREKSILFHKLMMERGVLVAPQGLAVLSTPMMDADARAFLNAAFHAMDQLR